VPAPECPVYGGRNFPALTAPGTDLFGVQDAAGGDGVAADAIDNVVTTSTVSCFDAPESACTKDNRGPYWNPQ